MSRQSETTGLATQAARLCEPLLAALHRLAIGAAVTGEDLQALVQASAVASYADRIVAVATAPEPAHSRDWRDQGDDWIVSRKGPAQPAPTPVAAPVPVYGYPAAVAPAAVLPPASPARASFSAAGPVGQPSFAGAFVPPNVAALSLIDPRQAVHPASPTKPLGGPAGFIPAAAAAAAVPVAPAAPAFAPAIVPGVVHSSNPEDHEDLAARNLDWRTALKTKTLRAQIAQQRHEESKYAAEEAKWDGVPQWKRTLLESRERKKYDAEAPTREAQAAEAERMAHFMSLPAWKQQLLINKLAGAQ